MVAGLPTGPPHLSCPVLAMPAICGPIAQSIPEVQDPKSRYIMKGCVHTLSSTVVEMYPFQ